MIFKAIVVQPAVFDTIRREMSKAAGTETGGALVGHVKGLDLILTDASGPGPRAKLEKYSVIIDGEHAQRFCDEANRRSLGEDDYVGDWHCHLGKSLKPSDLDYKAMETMAEFEFSPAKRPVSVIWSRPSGRVRGYYYDEASRKLRRIRIRNASRVDAI